MSLYLHKIDDAPFDSGLTPEEEKELSELEKWSANWRRDVPFRPSCICAGSNTAELRGYCSCLEDGMPLTQEEKDKFSRLVDLMTKSYYTGNWS